MDPNLTSLIIQNLSQPIILNPTINVTLTQPAQPWYKDWITALPAIASILVVILGGLITYYITITIEHKKRQFELKKQVYFEATKIFSDIFQFMILYRYNQEKIQPEKEKLQKEKENILAKKYEKKKPDKDIENVDEFLMRNHDLNAALKKIKELIVDKDEFTAILCRKLIEQKSEAEANWEKWEELSFKIDKELEIENVEMREKWLETRRSDVIYKLTTIRINIQICNAPDLIMNLFGELQQYAEENEPNKMVNLIYDKILPEIRKDIAGNYEKKKWYQFQLIIDTQKRVQ